MVPLPWCLLLLLSYGDWWLDVRGFLRAWKQMSEPTESGFNVDISNQDILLGIKY